MYPAARNTIPTRLSHGNILPPILVFGTDVGVTIKHDQRDQLYDAGGAELVDDVLMSTIIRVLGQFHLTNDLSYLTSQRSTVSSFRTHQSRNTSGNSTGMTLR